jgi:hypothetical protein
VLVPLHHQIANSKRESGGKMLKSKNKEFKLLKDKGDRMRRNKEKQLRKSKDKRHC